MTQLSTMRGAAGLALGGAVALAAYLRLIRPRLLRWGATDGEVCHALPGDDLVPRPRYETTRAVTIRATAAEIWPWLVGLGSDRAGFYSYTWLENRIGMDVTNADRIVAAFQTLAQGDRIMLGPDVSLRVALLRPRECLVAHRLQHPFTGRELDPGAGSPAPYLAWSWAFVLHEIDPGTTRLIARVRADYRPMWLGPVVTALLEPSHFVMERKMLLSIRERVKGRHSMIPVFIRATRSARAAARTAIFLLKVLPMLPSRPLDWVTKPSVIEPVRYPTRLGQADGDLYRPAAGSPHPGVVVCLGVVPFGVDNPQVPRLGAALARAGFAALIYWSPAMRDYRLDPDDIENIALAYRWLIEQPGVDPARSGLLGTCVGGSFALMAAASQPIRDRVAFVGAFAPYASMWTLALDVISGTRSCGEGWEHWPIDPLTRKVYVHSITALLGQREAELLRDACTTEGGPPEMPDLSQDGRTIYPLLTTLDRDEAERALQRLPTAMRERLAALSPLSYLQDIHAPVIGLLHDRPDLVIPVGESRHLWSALGGRPGVRYTEFAMFDHMDPTKVRLPLVRLCRELGKFYLALYPVFRQTEAT